MRGLASRLPARLGLLAVACVVLASCVRPIRTTAPEDRLRRDLDRVNAAAAASLQSTPFGGSLFGAEASASLVSDTRAYRTGDLVTVAIVERTRGSQNATTDLNRDASLGLQVPAFFGLEKKLVRNHPDVDPDNLVEAGSQKAFKGDGATTRETTLVASVTARVIGVYPNGDLALVGQKEVDINHERQVVTIAGIARRVDVTSSNSVSSDRLAELSVHLGGRGDVDAQQREGWLARVIQRVWPF